MPGLMSNNADAAADYLRRYQDVAAEGWDPWNHFQRHGQGEGRTWGPPPINATPLGPQPPPPSLGPLIEGLTGNLPPRQVPPGTGGPSPNTGSQPPSPGRARSAPPQTGGLSPSPGGEDYLSRYEDVRRAGVDPWEHYQMYGKNEGRTWNDLQKHSFPNYGSNPPPEEVRPAPPPIIGPTPNPQWPKNPTGGMGVPVTPPQNPTGGMGVPVNPSWGNALQAGLSQMGGSGYNSALQNAASQMGGQGSPGWEMLLKRMASQSGQGNEFFKQLMAYLQAKQLASGG